MENKDKNEQPKIQTTEAKEHDEKVPQSKNWQEYAKKILYFLRDWFIKLKMAYKITVISLILVILVLVLLAYLGIFGQEVANLIKQLVNKLLEQIKAKKS